MVAVTDLFEEPKLQELRNRDVCCLIGDTQESGRILAAQDRIADELPGKIAVLPLTPAARTTAVMSSLRESKRSTLSNALAA